VTVATKVELVEVLARGEFGTIIGTAENASIEFKSTAYSLGSHRSGRDLIADVASFANGRGGIILVGVKTARDPANQQDTATSVRGVDRGAVDINAYGQFLLSHIHPPVRDIDFRWYQGSVSGKNADLFAILIDPQDDIDKPFIVDRSVVVDDLAVSHAFGWPSRVGEDTHWESTGRVQSLIRQGLRGHSEDRSGARPDSLWAEADEQLKILESLDGWSDWANYSLQAVPLNGGEIKDFWGQFQSEARNWRGLRENGFGLSLHWIPLQPMGQGRAAAITSRTAVIVSKEGVLTAGALGSPNFLGWAQHSEHAWSELSEVKVNPIVLVEFTAEAIRFVYERIAPNTSASSWEIKALGRHLQDRIPLKLAAGFSKSWFPRDHRPAVSNDFDIEISGSGDVEWDASQVLNGVYGEGFGLGHEAVPFVQEGRVDLGALDQP